MAKEVDWASLGGSDNKSGGGKQKQFLKIDKTVLIRPIGKVVDFGKFYIPPGVCGNERAINIVTEVEDVEKAGEIISNIVGEEIKGSYKYAINVIDRADNQIKIYEGSKAVFKFFSNWSKLHNTHAGGKEGCDWSISAEGSGKNKRYTPMSGKITPLTADEIKRVQTKGEMFVLLDVYKATPLNEIPKLLSSITSDNGPSSGGVETSNSAQEDVLDDPINW